MKDNAWIRDRENINLKDVNVKEKRFVNKKLTSFVFVHLETEERSKIKLTKD